MHACHGKYHPFGNIHRVVGDAFKILCYHQQVEVKLPIAGIFRYGVY